MNRFGPIGRLGRYTATHFRTVAIAWALVALVLGFFAPKVEHGALRAPAGRPPARESVAARKAVDRTSRGCPRAR